MKKKIIIIGGGGHAKVLIDLIDKSNKFQIVGIVDPKKNKNEKINGIKVLGNDNVLPKYQKKGVKFLALGVGADAHKLKNRVLIWEKLRKQGFKFPALIHKNTIISKNTEIGEGAQIFCYSVVNSGASIGANVVLNTNSIIEHGCKISDNVFTGSRVTICGDVKVERNSFIGANVCILPKVQIKKNVVIAAGSVVINNIGKNKKIKGVPAKEF